MRTLAITVAYDGTDWSGFQRQSYHPSIQGALEKALSNVLREDVRIAAAGRTDAGVHALGQMISLCTANPMPIERITWVTNRYLPASIRVLRARDVADDFSARWSAYYRRYWYVVAPGISTPDPIRGRFCWQVKESLDIAAMNEAGRLLLGRHDFVTFCQSGSPSVTTVRELQRIEIRPRGRNLVIDLQADGFLYRMVRIIAANLVEIGSGQKPVSWLEELLHSRNRHKAGKWAPACGLYLMRIGYPTVG
ncbi:MAG: tRNA pseudouridine(38-40) synthase TruA [bacterium]